MPLVSLLRRKWLRRGLALAACMLLAANGFAYMHARALTHFSAPGPATGKPEQLTGWEKLKTLFLGARMPKPTNTRTPKDVGLEFEVATIPSTGQVALEAWIVRSPQSKGWVYLFHGFAESKQQVLLAARRFHDLGYSTLAVDFRGSGGSVGDNGTTIGYFEADDVAATVRWGRTTLGASDPILFGFSMGSAAILRAVGRLGVQARALVLESAFDRMLGTIENRFHMMHLPALPLAHLLVFWGGLQNGFSGFEHNPVDYAASVTSPTLLLQGERDERVTVREAQAIYQRLAGSKQLRIVTSVGHEVTQEMPEPAWLETVGGFLADVKR